MLMDILIYAGSALMVYNILRYFGFIKRMKWMSTSPRNRLVLFTPQVLLILFLIGYLFVGIFGRPDLVVAAILFGGSVFVFILLSILYVIVDRVRENEANKAALEKAKRESQAKTIFLSNMSHDLRTPMNAVIGYTQLAKRSGTTPEEMREYIGKIDFSSRHLLDLINDVLEMSRIESGKLTITEAENDLLHIFEETRSMFLMQMEEKGLRYEVRQEQVIDRRIFCDKYHLERILYNLVGNALKFTPAGEEVEVVVRQNASEKNTAAQPAERYGDYEIRVRDTGIGMSPEFVEKIFAPFERERTSTVSGTQGTGLGMSITKSIVDAMGGTIRVETEQGKGTEFIISLRFRIAEPDSSAGVVTATDKTASDTANVPESNAFAGLRLLLAEDNPINREIAVAMLSEEGFLIDTAENGAEAVRIMEESTPGYYAAVLMDVQMPVMNGLEAAKKIRTLSDPDLAKIPIIAMTANAFAEDIEAEKAAGMDAHISKPLDLTEMLSTIASVMR